MFHFNGLSRDHIAGCLVTLLGAGVLALGLTYHTGTLAQMGAGFMPVVFGVLMMAVGLAIGLTASAPTHEPEVASSIATLDSGPQWRGWICILAGVTSFVVFGRFGGFVPAVFAATFIAAMGDRQNTVRGAAALAVVVEVFSVAVFHYALRLQLPLFQWY